MKQALIAVNFIGFIHFLWDDIDLPCVMEFSDRIVQNEKDIMQM